MQNGQGVHGEAKTFSYGWLVSNTAYDCLQRQIAQKILKSKIKARTVKAGHYMAFKHSISFATDWAARLCKTWLQLIQNQA